MFLYFKWNADLECHQKSIIQWNWCKHGLLLILHQTNPRTYKKKKKKKRKNDDYQTNEYTNNTEFLNQEGKKL